MNEPKDNNEGFGASHCYASVYGEIIRKRKETGGNMAMGKHTAANATCCQRVVEDLQAAGLCNIADWAIWMMWWRMMDWQTAKQVDEMRLEEIAELRKRIDALETEEREGWCGHCACQSCYDAKRKADHW